MSLISHASISTTTTKRGEDGRETNAKKRKRDETERVQLDTRPFAIRPDASDPFGIPRNFKPVCLLYRAQLPLSYLDINTTFNRLFLARIPTLEYLDVGEDGTQMLVAEDMKERGLYAIESAGNRVYALCKLSERVIKEKVESMAFTVCHRDEQQPKSRALKSVEGGQPWWAKAAVQTPAQESLASAVNAAPRLYMSTSLIELSSETEPAGSQGLEAVEPNVSEHVLATTYETANTEPPSKPKTSEDVLQELAKHYLDALYLSRTSLAYFTKGPLSRARAAFAGESEADLDISELVAGLRDAILTASVIDKKYKDALSGTIKELPPCGLETPDKAAKKKRKKWKAKRDKGGFWGDEKEYLERWWREHDDSGNTPSSAEGLDARLKRRIPRLRSRETYLQVILALEVLALERALPPKPTEDGHAATKPAESQDAETQGAESKPIADSKKSKTKKPQDLPALLEVLLERLCIWHSLDSHSPAKKGGENGDKLSEESNDELKSFCVEVIIPFYVSRIPQHAAMVNKKLGGPSAPTPVKRKSTSSRRPGEPAIRQPPEKKPRKPLSRVTSEANNNASKQPPMLHRSATDTAVLEQHIKREGSETLSLHSIPQAKIPQPRKRTSLMHSISFSRREVDLSAMSQANDAKMRKKADVEEKLRDALTALKKPNRSLALKEVAESADMSFAKATAGGRLGTKKQAAVKAAVHVTATPKHPRTIKATPGRGLSTSRRAAGSSGGTYVPSSSTRSLAPPAAHEAAPTSSFAVPQTGHRPRHANPSTNVEETPSRGFAKFMPPGLARQPGTLESPIAARHSQAPIQQTPVKPVRSLSLVAPAQEPLVEASPNAVRISSPQKPLAENADDLNDGRPSAMSVYDALGWDEEPYEPLA